MYSLVTAASYFIHHLRYVLLIMSNSIVHRVGSPMHFTPCQSVTEQLKPQLAQTIANNATEVKFCSIHKLRTDYYDEKRMLAGVELPKTVALIKCHNALIKFGNQRNMGQITCGHPKPSADSGTLIYDGIDTLLADDVRFINIFQHDVQNGLGHAASIWSSIKAVSNLHVLAGKTVMKDYWTQLVGVDRVIHPGQRHPLQSQPMWFRTLYTGGGNNTYYYDDPMFPCATYSMEGFHDWRSDFASRIASSSDREMEDNLLLYLQRMNMDRSFVFWSCERDLPEISDTCDCQPVSEDDFIERLVRIGDRNGLETRVFQHSTAEKDAALFAHARVILGPHGGAFTNMIFLNEELNPIIIEANMHDKRTFFSHLAGSLGHRHLTYLPSIFEAFDGPNSKIHLEIDHYLEFVENTIRGAYTGMAHVDAVFHPCVPFMNL
mmetsp:Transcript_4336/g.8049  ORF Transcript_4336/g.8049 Transcript_4336/m.8049 type:complete len:434 (-) Transcript_4336:2170-3471(-)